MVREIYCYDSTALQNMHTSGFFPFQYIQVKEKHLLDQTFSEQVRVHLPEILVENCVRTFILILAYYNSLTGEPQFSEPSNVHATNTRSLTS